MGRLTKSFRTWKSFFLIVIALLSPTCSNLAEAAFASKFSFTAGELYTDNLFFSKNKEHDFVTTLTPTLSLLYSPTGENIPTLNLNISPSASIFARHSESNNFGDNWGLNGGYTYPYSPRLSFHVSDVLSRRGQYNLGPLTQGAFQAPNLPTSPPPTGGTLPGQGTQNLSNFNSAGSSINNNFAFSGTYAYRPDINFTANYSNNMINYIDQGGTDLYQTIGFRGVYNWRNDHNLHAGYSISVYKTRNNGTDYVNNFDFGDDYFSSSKIQIQLLPTLTLTGSTGLSFSTGSNGLNFGNNTNLTLTKIWETGVLTASFQTGLTPSYGVSGISQTTSVSANFNMQLSEKLNVLSNVYFPLYNTDNGNFKTFQASFGAQYQFTPWLASTLFYNYRWADSSSEAARNSDGILQAGTVRANSVYLTLTTSFDIWPNVGLTRSFTSPALTPIIRTPFPTAAPAAPSSSSAPATNP